MTHRNSEWRWLLKQLQPDHKTLADFRKHNLQPLRQVCRECTLLCTQLDLVAGELIAIDGSTGKAGNAQERHVTPDKLTSLLQPIAQRVEGYLKEGVSKVLTCYDRPHDGRKRNHPYHGEAQ